jgi:hypothetical protein
MEGYYRDGAIKKTVADFSEGFSDSICAKYPAAAIPDPVATENRECRNSRMEHS